MELPTERLDQGHRAVLTLGRVFRHGGTGAALVAVIGAAAVLAAFGIRVARHGLPDLVLALLGLAIALTPPAIVGLFAWACRATGALLIRTADTARDLVEPGAAAALRQEVAGALATGRASDESVRLRRGLRWLRLAWRGGGSVSSRATALLKGSRSVALLVNPLFLITVAVATVIVLLEILLAPLTALLLAL